MTTPHNIIKEGREEFKEECKKGWGKWSTASTHIELQSHIDSRLLSVIDFIISEESVEASINKADKDCDREEIGYKIAKADSLARLKELRGAITN